ncbi:hypothetical protein KBC79_01980, partial [Candidatus Woesebacteria bacterium]|nr:hypothetical protein [Candidatus Woesebacteria bacterium]
MKKTYKRLIRFCFSRKTMSLSPLLALAMFLIQAFAPGTVQAQLQNPADMDVKCIFGKSVTTTGEVSSGTYMGGAAGNSITGTLT